MLQILLIDDSLDECLFMTRTLEEEFAEVSVESVTSAEKLTASLERGCFDVAIADYQLSWNNGVSLLKRIKSWFPDCLAILMANQSSEALGLAAIEAGCDDYIAKPSNNSQRLIASIRTHLNLKLARQRRIGLENHLPALLNQLKIGVFQCTPDGQVLTANSAFWQLLDIPGPPHSLPVQLNQFLDWQPLSEVGTTHLSELQVQRSDGRQIWVRLQQTVCQEAAMLAIEGLLEDITAQKQRPTPSSVPESNYRATEILESITDAFVLVDRDWRILYANRETARLNQMEPSAIVGKTHWEMWPWSAGSIIEQNYRRAIADRVAVHFEVFYEPLTMWLEIHAYPCPEGLSIYFRDISDRKQAETELYRREQAFKSIADNAPDVIVRFDRNYCHLYISPAVEAITGLSPSTFIGKTYTELGFPEEFCQQWEEKLQTVFTTGQPLLSEFELSGADGQQYFQSRLVPEFDREGAIISVLGLIRDVSDYKRTEKALRQSQELLALAQKIGQIGACEWNLETGDIFWTEEMEAIYGLAPGTFGGTYQDWLAIVHPDDRARVAQLVEQIAVEGRDLNTEFRIQREEGTWRWMSAKASVFNESSGKPQRAIGVNMDITDLKVAEAGLRESEQRFRAAQELSLDGFTVLRSVRDEAGKIVDFEWTYVNPKAAEMLGSPVEALVGNRLLKVLPGNKTNSELFERYVQVAETGIPHDIELRYESEGIAGWFRNMTVKLNDGVAISFSNITPRKQAEIERTELLERERHSREAAEAANRVKDEFLAVLSHELRSPLNSILGWSKLLRSRHFDAVKTAKALETIERNAALQAQLIEDLLDVSRIMQGKVNLHLETVNLVVTIGAAIETMRLAAEAKAIEVDFSVVQGEGFGSCQIVREFLSETSYPEVLVLGDPSRLQQVVWNLLSNAIKFTPQGGLVEIALELSDVWAKIQVKDTGKGISQKFLPHVFEYFRQADASTTRHYGGLGLGLAIVRHLVELHGGKVEVESPGEGLGATFTVLLPSLNGQQNGPIERETPTDKTTLRGIRVLVVDDDLDTLELLAFTLMECGVEVMALSRAKDALAVIGHFKPDAIVSDIGMPEQDGYTFLRQVRLLPPEEGGNTPAVAVTAYAREEDRITAQAAGFQKHLSKPIDPNQLIAIVAELCLSAKADST